MYGRKKLNPYKFQQYPLELQFKATKDPDKYIDRKKLPLQTCNMCNDSTTFTLPEQFYVCRDCARDKKSWGLKELVNYKYRLPKICYLCGEKTIHYTYVEMRLCQRCYHKTYLVKQRKYGRRSERLRKQTNKMLGVELITKRMKRP